MKYHVITSGYKDYVSFLLGNQEIVQIKTTADNCGWISQELNAVVSMANAYMDAMRDLSKLRGIEPWIGDRQMKEHFQKTLYQILDNYQKQENRQTH